MSRLILVLIWSVVSCSWLSAAEGETPASTATIPGLEDARRDIALMREQETLLTTWQRDRDDLQRLADARQAAIAEKTKRVEDLRRQADERQQRAAKSDQARERLGADEAAVRAALTTVHQALTRSVPDQSLVRPLDDRKPVTELIRRMSEDLQKVFTAAGHWDVEIAEGTLDDGSSHAVQVLTAGFVAAWYASLDGASAGLARRDGDKWKLHPLAGRPRASIAEAIAQVRGSTPPRVVLLPPPEREGQP